MKSLKLDHELAQQVIAGEKTSTWRVFDDKDLSVNDEIRLLDKVDPERPETWHSIGLARIERIIEKKIADISETDMDGHEDYATTDDIVITFRKYYGNDVTETTPIKIIHFTFLGDDTLENVNDTSIDIKKVSIYTDGGSRGNPGPSALGYVIVDPATDKVLVDKGVYLGVTTNNQAEYLALKYALEEAQRMGVREIDAYLDSMLVVNQMKGIFKVKNRDLWPIHDAIKELISSFKDVRFSHVPREHNKLADAAVNRALEGHLNSS